VYFDFEREPGWERTVANLARNAPVSSTASMIGCDWAEGRWPGKGGIEFNGSNKRLRLTVPGTYASLTFLAWIRVDRLLHREHSLAMTESLRRAKCIGTSAGAANWPACEQQYRRGTQLEIFSQPSGGGSEGAGRLGFCGQHPRWNGRHHPALLQRPVGGQQKKWGLVRHCG